MCGICGFNWDDKELVKDMMKSIEHRGPDRGGIYSDGNFSLGHRRLSIIDLSDSGSQPMSNEDHSILIVYNGEIFNFLELRKELEEKKHSFYSNTDTEVIIHGYEEWGEDVVQRLNGQFAFCIYDLKKRKVFLARDRLGIKPLYYFWNKRQFIFASEIKAILQTRMPRILNLTAAREYLNLRYVPGEETLFVGIKKLLPGHSLTLQDDEMIIKPFWQLPIPKLEKYSLRTGGIAVKEILKDSVERQLIADVPVGIYLSGGIDSAAITALVSELKKEQNDGVKTFSVGFEDEPSSSEESSGQQGKRSDYQVNELEKARAIAEHFGTEHYEITIQENISELLPKLIWHLDMPHGDPVIIPQFKLSQLAAKKVKVVLSGEGSDEIFGGYVQYKTMLQARKARFLPFKSNVAENLSIKFLDQFYDYPSSIGEKGKEKLLEFVRTIDDKEKAYYELTSILSGKDRQFLFSDQWKEKEEIKEKQEHGAGQLLSYPSNSQRFFEEERKPLLNQLLASDIQRWLPNYVLHINDRMTMANSIEGRVPFLDHRLVEFSTRLPAHLKLQGNTTKAVLREAMRGILPNVEERKQPFFMPLDKWYKEELFGLAEQLFTPNTVKERGLFNYNYLKKIWENYEKSKLIYGKQLFTLINFELWQRMFIDSASVSRTGNIDLKKLL